MTKNIKDMNLIEKIIFFIKLSRPQFWIGVTLSFLIGMVFASHVFDWYRALILFIIACPILHTGLVTWNHYFDVEPDMHHKIYHPIPRGELTKKQALYLSVILYILGSILAIFFSTNWTFLLPFFTFVILSIIYSAPPLRLKKYFIKPFCVSFGFAFCGVLYGWGVYENSFSTPVILLAFMWFLIVSGMTVFIDFEDLKSDKKFGIKTFQVIFGQVNVAKALIIVHALLILLFFYLNSYFNILPPIAIFGTTLLLLQSFVAFKIMKDPFNVKQEIPGAITANVTSIIAIIWILSLLGII